MDLFQLQRAISEVERKKTFVDKAYRPFLGVVNYDSSVELIEKDLTNLCSNVRCEKLYFIVLNTSLYDETGEHWFLLAFERDNENVFYSFNSYHIVNTCNTFGFYRVDKNNNDECRRRKTVLSLLSSVIWRRYSNSGNNKRTSVSVVVINGLHQDFSTDECGYHVFRFVVYLYDDDNPHLDKKIVDWKSILRNYLRETNVTLINYNNKNLTRDAIQPILRKNDLSVRRFCERKDSPLTKKTNRIQAHDEYNLTRIQWNSKAKEFVNAFEKLLSVVISSDYHTIELSLSLLSTATKPIMKKPHQYKSSTLNRMSSSSRKQKIIPYERLYKNNFNPITGQHYASIGQKNNRNGEESHLFEEKYSRTQTSLSRQLLQHLFPVHVSLRINPLLNDLQFSGMIDDPDYLNSFIIQLPGDVSTMTTVGNYFKSTVGFYRSVYLSTGFVTKKLLRISSGQENK